LTGELLTVRPRIVLFRGTTMTERRSIFIGKKPLHAYVRAVVMTMQEGNRQVQLVARGATIGRAVDVAEICRRRNGIIAQGLPAEVIIQNIHCSSETLTQEDKRERTVSVLTIELDGIGDVPEQEEAEKEEVTEEAEKEEVTEEAKEEVTEEVEKEEE